MALIRVLTDHREHSGSDQNTQNVDKNGEDRTSVLTDLVSKLTDQVQNLQQNVITLTNRKNIMSKPQQATSAEENVTPPVPVAPHIITQARSQLQGTETDTPTYNLDTAYNAMTHPIRPMHTSVAAGSESQARKARASSSAVPEDVFGRKGLSYTFVCPHRKNGEHQVLWEFINNSGKQIAVSEGIFKPNQNSAYNRTEIVGDHSNGEYNLELSDLRETDEGTYICRVQLLEKQYQLELLAAPSDLILYNAVDNNIRGTEGRSLTVNCTAIGGKPEPDLRLEVDSQVFAGKQSIQHTISVLQRNNDKQLVKCQATSDALVSPMEKEATLYLYLKPSVPVFNQAPPRTNDTQPLVVSCTTAGSRPPGVIYWKVKSNLVTDGIVQQNTSDPSTDTYIVISTLTYSVDRSYNGQPITCGITHQTLSQAVETTKTISVYYAPDVTVSNKTHIQTDRTRTIQCTPDGNPDQYTYYKWQHKSIYGVLIREFDGVQNGILTLPSEAESDRYQDSGEYICTVGNGIGDKKGKIKQTGHGYLTINAHPVYTLDNNDISTQYGEFGKSTDVHVYIYSVPNYTQVTWFKGNTALSLNNKYRMADNLASVRRSFHGVVVQLDGFRVTLTINNLVEGDFSTYRLMVSNGYGQIMEHSVLLEPSSAPQTPTNFSVTDSSVFSISLEWDPGFNWGNDQTFHVEYRISGSVSWYAKEVPTNQQTGRQKFTLSGLEDSTLYEVRMYAANKFNRSLPTDIESITTVQDSQTSSAVIGGVTGGLVAFIVVLILVLLYLRKRGSVSRKQNTKSQRKEEAVYQNQLNSDMYEQIDGATNEIKDNTESKTEDEGSKKTYEPLNMRDNPNMYAELSDQEGQKQYVNTSEHYEALGSRNKPNVYEDLQNQKGIKEKEYVNMTF